MVIRFGGCHAHFQHMTSLPTCTISNSGIGVFPQSEQICGRRSFLFTRASLSMRSAMAKVAVTACTWVRAVSELCTIACTVAYVRLCQTIFKHLNTLMLRMRRPAPVLAIIVDGTAVWARNLGMREVATAPAAVVVGGVTHSF